MARFACNQGRLLKFDTLLDRIVDCATQDGVAA